MELNQAKSHSMKHGCEDEAHRQSKFQRIEPLNEPTDKPTKIIDLNDNCLVNIFGYLDLQSLFNVAIANEWLRPAANDVYQGEYGTKSIEIYGCDDYRPKTRAKACRRRIDWDYNPLKIWDRSVEICGLKTTLAYLRCFGASITELKIAYNHSKSKRYGYVHQYINDYCVESLDHLTFWDMNNTTIEQFQKNFANVQEIDLICVSNLNEQWPSFFKCFPNLLRLSINPTKISINTLLDMIKDNEFISRLSMVTDRTVAVIVDSVAVKRLVNEHPALVRLDLFGYQFSANDAIALTRQLCSLMYFRFWMLESEHAELKSKPEGWVRSRAHFYYYRYKSVVNVEMICRTQQ